MHRMVVAAPVLAPRIVRRADLIGHVGKDHLPVGLPNGLCGRRRPDVLSVLSSDRLNDAVTLCARNQAKHGGVVSETLQRPCQSGPGSAHRGPRRSTNTYTRSHAGAPASLSKLSRVISHGSREWTVGLY